ncbi:hypothetical protein [Paenibacillus herberti]|uniref:Uncharacterized protein n=1 Tax=Paenibacillus herberti TaxID=1619309 RepID=A0A229P0L8_9BACL|nr:hypothetical protein [Paenibacillus herberti]OXM15786.1 hypothetical protein CGZ75_03445 [Paenibacillus herberti]
MADQSRHHASNIAGIIKDIEDRTDEAFKLIGRDVEEAGKGVEAIAAEQRQEINKIGGMITDLAQTSQGLHGLLGRFKTD